MVRELDLTFGKVALVDDEDYPRVAEYKWTVGNTAKPGINEKWYVRRTIRVDGKTFNIYLHRFILGVPDGVTVDHIDGDPLNNQKSNLRMASYRQQSVNRGKPQHANNLYKGVHPQGENRWFVLIRSHGKRKYLGTFRDPAEAARVYDAAAKRLHGEFAWTNFPDIHPDADAYVAELIEKGGAPTRQRPRAVLTTEQAHQIRADYAAGGVTQRELADRYGCHYSTISRVVKKSRYAEDVRDQVIRSAA